MSLIACWISGPVSFVLLVVCFVAGLFYLWQVTKCR